MQNINCNGEKGSSYAEETQYGAYPSEKCKIQIRATGKDGSTYTENLSNSSDTFNVSEDSINQGGVYQNHNSCMWMPCGNSYVSMPEIFTQNQQQQLYIKHYEAELARYNKFAIDSFEYENKRRLIKDNADAQIRVAERKEELKTKRLMLSISVCEDADGYLVKQLKDSVNNIVDAKVICGEKHVRLYKLRARGKLQKYCIYYLTWDNRPAGKKLFFTEDTLTAENIKKAFTQVGIYIKSSRDYKDNLMDAVLTHLTKYCKVRFIPLSEGWNKMDGVWHFIDYGEVCMRGVIKYGN